MRRLSFLVILVVLAVANGIVGFIQLRLTPVILLLDLLRP